jgi:hypothetical protein
MPGKADSCAKHDENDSDYYPKDGRTGVEVSPPRNCDTGAASKNCPHWKECSEPPHRRRGMRIVAKDEPHAEKCAQVGQETRRSIKRKHEGTWIKGPAVRKTSEDEKQDYRQTRNHADERGWNNQTEPKCATRQSPLVRQLANGLRCVVAQHHIQTMPITLRAREFGFQFVKQFGPVDAAHTTTSPKAIRLPQHVLNSAILDICNRGVHATTVLLLTESGDRRSEVTLDETAIHSVVPPSSASAPITLIE